ncbi:hypothetical protein C1646_668906 [Rhizophagus diaphanus]|nr:hypothetical protein C1646_668906 [Rhizophagus diaphanus] [Rhizophagus sp. MUCL 43196]
MSPVRSEILNIHQIEKSSTQNESLDEKQMKRKLSLERLKRVVENNYNFTDNVKKNMTLFSIFYCLAFVFGLIFIYINARYTISVALRIIRNSITGAGTFASLITSMKDISETISSAHKEIRIPDIDKNIVVLSLESGLSDEDLVNLKDAIKFRNTKLKILKHYRSLWTLFGSIILIVIIILDFNFDGRIISLILDGILCFVGVLGVVNCLLLNDFLSYQEFRNVTSNSNCLETLCYTILNILLFINLYLSKLVDKQPPELKDKILFKNIKHYDHYVYRVTFRQRDRKNHEIEINEKDIVEGILHGLNGKREQHIVNVEDEKLGAEAWKAPKNLILHYLIADKKSNHKKKLLTYKNLRQSGGDEISAYKPNLV